ncbi:sensor histidine kinase [Actinoplanes sp. NPDC048988]|uniref:sensor histidine kinase n=1 Tax=Actinoplanes sp. NPDC048988 TaxID=3363901 RepID=UPI003716F4C6
MTLLRRAAVLIRADDPETGWIVRVALSALLIWALIGQATAPLIAALVCWFGFVATDHRWPRLARVSLAVAALLPAAVVGDADDGSAQLFLFAALFIFVMLPRTPLRAVLGLTAAVLAVMSLSIRGSAMLAQAAVIVIVVLFSLHRREHRLRTEERARTHEAQARAAALDERARIARELHDVLAHSLGALAVQLEVAEAELTEKRDLAAAATRIRRARKLARDGLTEARSAVAALRADVPPMPRALADLAAAHRADHGVQISLRTRGSAHTLNPAAEVALVRTAREAFTNAARHAPGADVTVSLEYTNSAVRLIIANKCDGADSGGGYGLVGARERLALAGGTLEAGAADGMWRVVAEVPA